MKKMTTEERVRRNKARNLAAATKKVANLTLDDAMKAAVAGMKAGEGGARVFAVAMREEYGPYWYRVLDSEASTDNEKAIKKSLGERRTACRNLSIERGLSNPHAPWSAMLKVSRELDNPYGETREKKPLTQKQRETALSLYKACMKAEAPSEIAMKANEHFAAVLVLYGVDIAAINAKL